MPLTLDFTGFFSILLLFFRRTCYKIGLNQKINLNKEEINMAYVIGDACVSCGTCAGECPVGAISEGDGKYEIDANSCVDCGTCAGVCPVGTIEQA